MKLSNPISILLLSAAGLSTARPFNFGNFDIGEFFSSFPVPADGFIGLPKIGAPAMSSLLRTMTRSTTARQTTTGLGFVPSATPTGRLRATTTSNRRATPTNGLGGTGVVAPTLTSVPNNGAPGSNDRLLSLSLFSTIAGGGGGGGGGGGRQPRPTRIVAILENTPALAEPTDTQSEDSGAE